MARTSILARPVVGPYGDALHDVRRPVPDGFDLETLPATR